MKFQLSIGFYFLLITFFNSFTYIICENYFLSYSNESQCLMITLYNNGTLERKYVPDNYTKEKIISIGSVDKIILYDCLNSECSYNNRSENITKEDALKKKSHDSEFYSCYIYEEYYINATDKISNSGCIEVEKNEYEKFRSYIKDINDLKHINEQEMGILECFDINYIKNKYIYLSILFLLFLF